MQNCLKKPSQKDWQIPFWCCFSRLVSPISGCMGASPMLVETNHLHAPRLCLWASMSPTHKPTKRTIGYKTACTLVICNIEEELTDLWFFQRIACQFTGKRAVIQALILVLLCSCSCLCLYCIVLLGWWEMP